MAFDAFLKLDGIKGESQGSNHKGEIDILSFRMGCKQTGTQSRGAGGGAGKATMQDMQFVKKVDAASPLLLLHCANGTHIKDATFVVCKAGGSQLEYLKIKLTEVLVSSFGPRGEAERMETNYVAMGDRRTPVATGVRATGSDEIPLEDLSLNFAKIEVSYQPQGADGKAQGGPIMGGWDLKLSRKV